MPRYEVPCSVLYSCCLDVNFSLAQEQLIEEQTAKLAQYGAVSQSNPSVQFLSREAVNEEKKTLAAKVKRLEDTIKEKDVENARLKRQRMSNLLYIPLSLTFL
jgi:hypothetical protein